MTDYKATREAASRFMDAYPEAQHVAPQQVTAIAFECALDHINALLAAPSALALAIMRLTPASQGGWGSIAQNAFNDGHRSAQQAAADLVRAAAGVQGAVPEQLIRAFNSGYKSGHHDTVEGNYTDIDQRDMFTYHADVIAEMITDGTLAAPVPALAAPGEAIEAEKLQRLTAQGMADCMDMVRTDLIEMGIIDKAVAPMFIPEAIASYVKALAASSERAPEPSVASVADDAEFVQLARRHYGVINWNALVKHVDSLIAARTGAVGGLTDEQREVLAFLDGSGPLEGYHFGDSYTPNPKQRFWWRKNLREAFAAQVSGQKEST